MAASDTSGEARAAAVKAYAEMLRMLLERARPHGATQSGLARFAGVSETTVSHYLSAGSPVASRDFAARPRVAPRDFAAALIAYVGGCGVPCRLWEAERVRLLRREAEQLSTSPDVRLRWADENVELLEAEIVRLKEGFRALLGSLAAGGVDKRELLQQAK